MHARPHTRTHQSNAVCARVDSPPLAVTACPAEKASSVFGQDTRPGASSVLGKGKASSVRVCVCVCVRSARVRLTHQHVEQRLHGLGCETARTTKGRKANAMRNN